MVVAVAWSPATADGWLNDVGNTGKAIEKAAHGTSKIAHDEAI
jgi:hypothetical protein